MFMYSFYDSKAEGYLQPFFATTRGLAIRMVMEALRNQEQMARFAADYTLFELGHFDTVSGEFKSECENLGQATQYLEV